MRKQKRWLSIFIIVMTCLMCAFVEGCKVDTPPKKLKDGISIELAVDEKCEIVVADYITTNGYDVKPKVDKPNVTAEMKNGKVTVVAKEKGNCVLTISCGEVEVYFNVMVSAKKYSVTVDGASVGKYEYGSEYELPQYSGALDGNHEFIGWIVNGDSANLKQATDKITIQANVVITAKVERKEAVIVKPNDEAVLTVGSDENGKMSVAVADYITTYGREVMVGSGNLAIASVDLKDGIVTVTALSQGSTIIVISCGDVNATITITVKPEVIMPTFENGSIAIDLFKQTSGVYTAVILSNPLEMSLSYSLAEESDKAFVDENGIVTYNADVVESVTLTINVVATNPSDNLTYDCSFKVAVVVTDTTPQSPKFSEQFLNYDIYTAQDGITLDGVLVEEDDNFTYAYKVNGNEVDASYKFKQTATVNVEYTYKGNTAKSGTTSFAVTVTTDNTTPMVIEKEIVVESVIDIINNPTIDLTANVTNLKNVKGYEVDGTTVNINDGILSVVDNGYSETPTKVTFLVSVINTKEETVTYTYEVNIINTEKYRVKNGGFELGNLDGWNVSENMGNVVDFSEYWEGISHQKEGNYFFHGHENKGVGEFVLQSDSFIVGGSGWITFQMGAATHYDEQYIEVVQKSNDSVIAHITNIAFADNGGFNSAPDQGNVNKVSGLTLMKYKLNLSSVKGEEVYVRIVDKWAYDAFGMILFDNLVSYIPNAESILPEYLDVTTACFVDTTSQIDLKDNNTLTVVPIMKSQGVNSLDYTYVGSVVDNLSGITVNGLTITATKSGKYKVNYVVNYNENEVATFAVEVTVSNTTEMPTFENIEKTFEFSDWNTSTAKEIALPNDGERFGYYYSANVGTIENRALLYTPTASGEVVITITVTLTDKNYTVEDLETITFNVTLVFKEEGIMLPTETPADEHYDVFTLVEKDFFTINFASEKYIIVPANKTDAVVYSATLSINDGDVQEILLESNSYEISLENLTDVATKHTFVVTAVCDESSVSYTLNIYLLDSTSYRLTNGGFEDGISGWNVVGNVGAVSNENNYWVGDADNINGYEFRKDGDNLFSAYAPNIREDAIGMLQSSTFVVSSNRIITFRLGAAKHDVFVDVVDAETGAIYVRYNNPAWSPDKPNACALYSYKAVLPEESIGKTVYIRIVDNAINDYGLFFCDSFITYYAQEPTENFMQAGVVDNCPTNVYEIFNGGFENGNLDGWRIQMDEIGVVTDASGYWGDNIPYEKEGNYLFTGVESFGADTLRENRKGTLTSSLFVLKSGAYLSFKVGGGQSRDMFIAVVDVISGRSIILRNEAFQDAVLKTHYYQNVGADMLCYIKVVDFESSGWGCFALDDFKTTDVQPDCTKAVNRAEEYLGVQNGSFETGNLESWTVETESTLGFVVNGERAEEWYQTNENTKDGDFLFTFYNGVENVEDGTGKMRSKLFVLEKNGIVTFRFGAAKNAEVYINLYTADGTLVAQFRNGAHDKPTLMNYYYYQSVLTQDTACYFEIVDNATSDYGCFVVDDFRANVGTIPDGAIPAHN